MISKEDSAALFSSEVFKNYLKNELEREKLAAEKRAALEETVYDDFEEFQKKVNASAKLKETFKKLQHAFTVNPESTKNVDPAFVQGVLLLDLEDE